MILNCGAELTMSAEGLTLDLSLLGTTKVTLSLTDAADLAGALVGGAHGVGRWSQLADMARAAEAAAETDSTNAAMD